MNGVKRWVLLSLVAAAAAGCGETNASGGGSDAVGDAGFRVLLDAGTGRVAPSEPVADAAVADAGSLVDPDANASPSDGGTPPRVPPDRVLFVGNSYTYRGDMPYMVGDFAEAAGFPRPTIEFRAPGGMTLERHRADGGRNGAPARVDEGWDVVILQEHSLRPVGENGTAAQFKRDVVWFYDRALDANPACRVILYETWARRRGHNIYNRRFNDPIEMQEVLRTEYFDAAENYIPMNSQHLNAGPAEVARVGDAWEVQLAGGEPPRLHNGDNSHPSAQGRYLTALVFFVTIYGVSPAGLPDLGIDPTVAAELQASADVIRD